MASTIVTKNSSTASAVPLTGDLTQGELAVNVTDKRLFTKNSGGTVVELGTNPASLALPNGTANGVAYLNGSKVVTTGSALTFDGTTFQYTGAANFATSTGNVGIGTSSPSVKLHISGAGETFRISGGGTGTQYQNFNTTGGNYYLGVSSSTGTGLLSGAGAYSLCLVTESARNIHFGTNNTLQATLDTSGNLGLGVTPSAWSTGKALEVNAVGLSLWGAFGNTYLNANYYYNSADKFAGTGYALQYLQVPSTGAHIWKTSNASGTAGNAITFTQAMTLDASGNLGIGSTSPNIGGLTRALTLNTPTGGNYSGVELAGAGTLSARFITNNAAGTYIGSQVSIPLIFETNATERARIDSSGNLLVGTTSNLGTGRRELVLQSANGSLLNLGINGAADSFQLICDSGPNALIVNKSNTPMVFYTNNTERLRITAVGESLFGGNTDNGAYNVQCNGTGVWGAGAYVNGSDRNLKDNIQDLDSGLDVVMAMRSVTFQYKPEHSKDQSTQPGFIAQELQEAMTGKNYLEGIVQAGPNYLNVAYQNIIPLLTKAIQEQQALITQLQADVAALKGN